MQTKTRFLPFLDKSGENKKTGMELCLWFLVHLTIPLALLISIFISGPVSINTSLFDMLPQSNQAKAVMEADSVFGERNGREIIILCASHDFQKAKTAASRLYENFNNTADFESLSLYFDSSVIADFNRYLFDYRFMIASPDTLSLLENNQAQEIAYDALSRIFGAFNFFPLDNIDKDPFLLTERRMGDFLGSSLLSGAMTLKDDVIAAEKDGIHHVLLRMTLAPGAVSLQADRNVIGEIYSKANVLKQETLDLEFYFSGIPFHSYESSSGAQREISVISTVTLILIFILFLFTFRSGVPVIASIIAIAVSLGIAVSAALLFFREIHIITFVFGTTLIGTCVDYSVHFFVHWKGNASIQNGAKIRAHVVKNITMSFISTQICFIVFFLSPFPILKQFAVFSMAGLISSYLTFFCIYPRLKIPQNEKRKMGIFTASRTIDTNIHAGFWFKKFKNIIIASLCLIAGVLLIIYSSNIKIKNDISSLYTMSDSLLESEIRAAQVLDIGSPGWYFIVTGKTADETLVNEEKLTTRLEREIKNENLESFFATSVFVPSENIQNKTYNAMKALIPLAPSQFEYIGFPPEYAIAFEEAFASSKKICLPHDAPSQAGISNLWIGKIDDTYYSCVMPLRPTDETVFRKIADEFDFVYFINKAKDIGADMDTLTRTMLYLFLAAYVIVSVIIFIAYPKKDSVKICSVPLILVIVSLTVLAVRNIPIGFFSAAALVLVFGLSLDYIFFMTGKKQKSEKKLTLTGVTLSFLTTLLSFGALSLSNFKPVHLFGLTVCAGLGAAFISAIFLQASGSESEEENSRISGSPS